MRENPLHLHGMVLRSNRVCVRDLFRLLGEGDYRLIVPAAKFMALWNRVDPGVRTAKRHGPIVAGPLAFETEFGPVVVSCDATETDATEAPAEEAINGEVVNEPDG